MESRSNEQERERQRNGSAGEFEEGSDTDNEDILSQSVRDHGSLLQSKKKTAFGGSRMMKQATSSPATLLVEHA